MSNYFIGNLSENKDSSTDSDGDSDGDSDSDSDSCSKIEGKFDNRLAQKKYKTDYSWYSKKGKSLSIGIMNKQF
jgi:hypothetical protein